jgi:glycosyltransferase involved in cell wall biosynthesis
VQIETLNKYKIDYSNSVELTEEEIQQEFTACDLVFFPSTYEGFGLPVIEGFKAGRPVITSNLEPMKDIAAGAALLVDPFRVASIRKGIVELITNPALRDSMVEKGFKVVKHYEVNAIAEQYLNLWKKIADQPKQKIN